MRGKYTLLTENNTDGEDPFPFDGFEFIQELGEYLADSQNGTYEEDGDEVLVWF